MHILIAADADYVVNDIVSALTGPDTSFTICHEGRDVSPIVAERTPDLLPLFDALAASTRDLATRPAAVPA